MKKTRKLVTAMLMGTLTFSSIGVAPMAAFADEAVTDPQAADQYVNIVNGAAEGDQVDVNGEPVLQGQGIQYVNGSRGWNNRYYYDYPTRYYDGYVSNYGTIDNSIGSFKNDWKKSRWNFYAPTKAVVGYGANNYYVYGNVTYPRYASDYSLYNGRVSIDLYKQYAAESVRDVQNKLANKAGVSQADMNALANDLAGIRASSSWSTIETYLDDADAIAIRNGVTMTRNWYLPVEYDYRYNWRDYDWRWDWRPYERDRKSSSSSSSDESASKKVAVYRYSKDGDFVYTTDDKGVTDYKLNGKAFSARQKTNKPVYQYHNTETNAHYYTTDKNDAVATDGKWAQDCVAFYANTNETGKAVHRLEKSGKYLYTADSSEVETNTKAGWVDKGVVFYVAS